MCGNLENSKLKKKLWHQNSQERKKEIKIKGNKALINNTTPSALAGK